MEYQNLTSAADSFSSKRGGCRYNTTKGRSTTHLCIDCVYMCREVQDTVLRRLVTEDFLEEVSCEERLKLRREVEGVSVNGCLSHLKLVHPVIAKPQWLQMAVAYHLLMLRVYCGSAVILFLTIFHPRPKPTRRGRRDWYTASRL